MVSRDLQQALERSRDDRFAGGSMFPILAPAASSGLAGGDTHPTGGPMIPRRKNSTAQASLPMPTPSGSNANRREGVSKSGVASSAHLPSASGRAAPISRRSDWLRKVRSRLDELIEAVGRQPQIRECWTAARIHQRGPLCQLRGRAKAEIERAV